MWTDVIDLRDFYESSLGPRSAYAVDFLATARSVLHYAASRHTATDGR